KSRGSAVASTRSPSATTGGRTTRARRSPGVTGSPLSTTFFGIVSSVDDGRSTSRGDTPARGHSERRADLRRVARADLGRALLGDAGLAAGGPLGGGRALRRSQGVGSADPGHGDRPGVAGADARRGAAPARVSAPGPTRCHGSRDRSRLPVV